jgi:uncharacterized protein (DUF4415 family)
MTASKHATDHASRLSGETDLTRVDAHVIAPEEYDEIPELTDEMMARAVPGSDPERIRRGRPAAENRKRLVSIRLDPDVLDALRATGPGWQTRVNDALRDWLNRAA